MRAAGRVYVPQVRNERQQYLDRTQAISLIRAMTRNTRGAALTAFYSGMRLAEVVRAVANEDSFVLADTKNDMLRIVPIHRKVAVYSRNGISISPRWIQCQCMRVTRGAGLSLDLHDL